MTEAMGRGRLRRSISPEIMGEAKARKDFDLGLRQYTNSRRVWRGTFVLRCLRRHEIGSHHGRECLLARGCIDQLQP